MRILRVYSYRAIRRRCFYFSCIFFFFLFQNYVYAEDSINKIVASVAGEAITYYDVLVAMYPQLQEAGLSISNINDIRVQRLKEMALNELINNILIRQEAVKYNVKITEQDIDSEMRKIARDNDTSIDVLEQQIRLQGSSIDAFKKNLRHNLLQQRMIASFVFRKIVITVQEVEEYYKAHSDEFKTDSIYTIAFISALTQGDAKNIIAQANTTSIAFASLQKSYALQHGSERTGVLEHLVFSELSSEWQQALLNAKQSDILGPVLIDGSYFVLYVQKKEEGTLLPFEDVYTKIEGKLRDAKFSLQYAEFIQSLRAKADIKIYQ